MWAILLCMFLQGIVSVQSMDMDASLRSRLGHFNTTRNNHVKPEDKTKARDYILKTFKDFGLDTWTEEFPSNQAGYPGINVVGRVNGRHTGSSKDKILIIGSHYDTVKTTNGVDDNGSGISVLLQALAKYKSINNAKCTQNYTLLFVAFDLEEYQGCINQSSCSCSGIICGSNFFVKNLTRHLNGKGSTVQGAFVLETVLNFNNTPKSQSLPQGTSQLVPAEYKRIEQNQFRGDFLPVIGRKDDDKQLMDQLVSNYEQGRFKAMKVSLPFNGRPKDITDALLKAGISDFLRSDHASFWNGNNSWPAVFITDTADFRGFMKTCYHQMCDSMDKVTPDMITFMGKTTDAIVGAAHTMTGRDCPPVIYCADETRITANKKTIFSPLHPSQYANNVSCGWVRESEYPQKLVFESFDLETSTDCKNDYVEVIVGEKLVGRYCGSTKPEAITTSEKKLRVRFVSDEFVTGNGFKITWSTNAPTSLAVRFLGFQSMVSVLSIMSCLVLYVLQ